MSLDIHNPYCSLWHDTAMSFPAPWDEQKTYEHPFSFFGTLLQSTKKTEISSSSTKRKSLSHQCGDDDSNSLPTFSSLYGSASSVTGYSFSPDNSGSRRSRKHKQTSIKFSNTVSCVLIPSREDLAPLRSILWQSDEEVALAIAAAQHDIEGMLTTSESGLSLYSAMSLLYRPCQNRSHSQLRILIVDDSVVCVKMMIYMLTKGKRMVGIHDDLVIHHCSTTASAMELFQSRSYNVIIIDECLNTSKCQLTRSTSSSVTSSDGNTSNETSGSDDDSTFVSNKSMALSNADNASAPQGHDLCKLLRRTKNENCVIVGISSLMCDLYNTSATSDESDSCNKIKKQFLDSGADFVWPKPLPSPALAWDDLLQRLPLEF